MSSKKSSHRQLINRHGKGKYFKLYLPSIVNQITNVPVVNLKSLKCKLRRYCKATTRVYNLQPAPCSTIIETSPRSSQPANLFLSSRCDAHIMGQI